VLVHHAVFISVQPIRAPVLQTRPDFNHQNVCIILSYKHDCVVSLYTDQETVNYVIVLSDSVILDVLLPLFSGHY